MIFFFSSESTVFKSVVLNESNITADGVSVTQLLKP
jgi:hypothetical protein